MPASSPVPSARSVAACKVAFGVGTIAVPMNSCALSNPFALVMWAMKISRIASWAGSTSSLSSCGKTRSYQIIATAVNAGTAPAAMDANNVIHVDPPLKTNFQTGTHTVKPKEVITVKFEADLEAGSTHQFTFMADQLQQLKESNETNNSYVLTLKVPPVEANEKGDLTVSAAFLEFVQSNQTYWLVVRIKNLGPNPVTLCKDMVVWETSRHPPDFSMIGVMSDSRTLKPGEVCEPSTSAFYQMPKGTYTFIIQVDPRNLLEETNKSNNIYILTARVPEDLRKR